MLGLSQAKSRSLGSEAGGLGELRPDCTRLPSWLHIQASKGKEGFALGSSSTNEQLKLLVTRIATALLFANTHIYTVDRRTSKKVGTARQAQNDM